MCHNYCSPQKINDSGHSALGPTDTPQGAPPLPQTSRRRQQNGSYRRPSRGTRVHQSYEHDRADTIDLAALGPYGSPAPRAIATRPERATSRMPYGCKRPTKVAIFSSLPVTSRVTVSDVISTA